MNILQGCARDFSQKTTFVVRRSDDYAARIAIGITESNYSFNPPQKDVSSLSSQHPHNN